MKEGSRPRALVLRSMGLPIQLLRRLGAGSSSVVYLASDPSSGGSLVAAKFCSSRCFAAELAAIEALGQHPHIVALRGYLAEEPRVRALLFEVMDGSLARHLRCCGSEGVEARGGSPLPDGEALALASCVSSALVRLSAVQLVHGDLRSTNVLVRGRTTAKVADFGNAYWSASDGPLDIRSLGLLLREMTTGLASLVDRLCERRASRRPTARGARALILRAAGRARGTLCAMGRRRAGRR